MTDHAAFLGALHEQATNGYIDEQIAEAVTTVAAQLETRTRELETAQDAVKAAVAESARIAGELAASEDALAVARGETTTARAERDALDAKLSEAVAEIARLEDIIAGLDPVDPEPAHPIVGACPLTGGMSAAGVQRVVDRWGKGAAVRLFSASGWTVAPAVGDAGRLLLSWKPSLSVPVNEAQCVAALVNVPAGSKVCVWHEPDVKARKGDPVAPMKARAREFYDIVKRNRPDLDVMAVLSGWTFDPSTSFDPLAYVDPEAFDVLALDLDGLYGPKDYRPVVEKAQDWMAANGVGRWTVGEFGVKTDANFTPADRVGWLTEQTGALVGNDWPPEEICLFEVDTTDARPYILTTPAEIAAYGAFTKEN